MKLQKLMLSGLLICGCASTTSDVSLIEALPMNRNTPIFVTAARQKQEIKQALRDAGFVIVDQLNDDARLLRVTIGMDQAYKPCGTLNNVRFQLRYNDANAAELSAKGWTGACQPNILAQLSRDLWQTLFEPPKDKE